MTNKLANNATNINFSDLEQRINKALTHKLNKSFTTFTGPKKEYFNLSLTQLLSFQDQEFIEACFCTILNREADQESINHYLKKLQQGYDPRSIIAFLRYSKEGKQRFANTDNSLPPLRKYQIFSLPIIGKLIPKLLPLYQKMRL